MENHERTLVSVAIFAALYAVTSLLTAYIPTGPFFIQFRPAIAVPMVVAVISTPLVAGLSAALGTFIASVIRYGTPIFTIFSGAPANFLGFFMMSYSYKVLRRRFNWVLAVILSSTLGLIVGSLIIGFGLWFLSTTLVPEGLEAFKSMSSALKISFIMVFAPAPVALVIALGIIKALEKSGKISLK